MNELVIIINWSRPSFVSPKNEILATSVVNNIYKWLSFKESRKSTKWKFVLLETFLLLLMFLQITFTFPYVLWRVDTSSTCGWWKLSYPIPFINALSCLLEVITLISGNQRKFFKNTVSIIITHFSRVNLLS